MKNLAFLMTPDGQWQLSPAFDVTYAKGNEWTRTHQVTVGGKDADIMRRDLLALGASMDVPHDGAGIIAEVVAALDLWGAEARAAGVPPAWIARIANDFRRFA